MNDTLYLIMDYAITKRMNLLISRLSQIFEINMIEHTEIFIYNRNRINSRQ